MYPYILWKDVQDCLRKRFDDGEEQLSFYQVCAELLIENPYTGPEPEYPDFMSWDCKEPEGLHTLFCQIPVTEEDISSRPLDRSVFSGFTAPRYVFTRDDNVLLPCARKEGSQNKNDGFTIHYVLKRNFELILENKHYDLTDGTLTMISPHMPYRMIGDEHGVACTILVMRKCFQGIFGKVLSHKNVLTDYFYEIMEHHVQNCLLFHFSDSVKNHHLIRDMFAEYYSDGEYRYDICTSLLELLLLQAVKSGLLISDGHPGAKQAEPQIPLFLQYIHEHAPSLSLENMADIFHYSKGYISSQLKKATGRTFQELVTEEKIHIAELLLADTTDSIEKIGEQTGFQSLVSFSRRFHQMTGMSPTQYRRKQFLNQGMTETKK